MDLAKDGSGDGANVFTEKEAGMIMPTTTHSEPSTVLPTVTIKEAGTIPLTLINSGAGTTPVMSTNPMEKRTQTPEQQSTPSHSSG